MKIPTSAHPTRRSLAGRQRGIAAVEFALILPLLIVLLVFPIFFGRVLMSYSIAQKAAHDAALYLAGIPKSDMKEYSGATEAAAVAMVIAREELAEINPGGPYPVVVDVYCDGAGCGTGIPVEVSVIVRMRMFDAYFNDFTWFAVGPNGIHLQAKVVIPYIGA